MKLSRIRVPLVFLLAVLPAAAQRPASVRIILGVTDRESVQWDGAVRTQAGTVASVEPWRFGTSDKISGASWHLSTHPASMFQGAAAERRPNPVVANGVIANFVAPDGNANIEVTTAQGNFEFRLNELAYGKRIERLDGRVWVDLIPPSVQITKTPEDEDYPSAAARNDEVWMAYVQFRHNPLHGDLRVMTPKPIQDFANLKAPAGGDQILARKYSGGTWGEAIPITEPGGDRYRTAVAIDGQGRPWVFWSENVAWPDGPANFELFARVIQNGTPGAKVRITKDPGSDVDPVAATDSNGTIWVAWQGWRNGRASIFAAAQKGNTFGMPTVVSKVAANQWDPAIAADQTGRVTVAWDSYQNGNYDIFARTFAAGEWGPEKPLAATTRYEAYPSVAYDKSGRLWVAYEEGGRNWGKDFGAYSTTGVSLYAGRAIRLRGFEPDGRVVQVGADLGAVLPGTPNLQMQLAGVQNDAQDFDPDPTLAANRAPNTAIRRSDGARNSMPRLLVDGSGRIWLAFRSPHPIWWCIVGTVWAEQVVSFDGNQWTNPVYLNHSDNLLDNRPALVSPRPGQLLTVGSSDNRRLDYLVGDIRALVVMAALGGTLKAQDPYNNDLYSSELDLGPAVQPITPAPAAPVQVAAVEEASQKERAAIQRVRDQRSGAQQELKILRGEFHRHSEISMDGGGDGTILDQFRYLIDVAGMDWAGCCDHDNGWGREYSWWTTQKLTDILYSRDKFVPMFSYERSVQYPEGHRNVIFAQRGVRTLPRLPLSKENDPGHAPDTQMLYAYLRYFNGIAASHSGTTQMGTDWRDNDPVVEPVVEIYQGHRQNYERPDAPRAGSAADSIPLWRPKGFVSLALEKGYKLGFEASSDHISTHMSYCNVLVKDGTRESILDAFKKRHVYGATDNILADFRSGPHIMGDEFSTEELPTLRVKLTGTSKFTKVVIVKDNQYVYSAKPDTSQVEFSWRDNAPVKGKTSYYYVRGEQDDGELVWLSPMWITYTGQAVAQGSGAQ